MSHQIISTPNAPAAVGPYSQAVLVNGTVYVSGQIGLVPETGIFVDEKSVEKQTHQVLKNLKAVVEAAGSSMDKVVKTTIFLQSMGDFVMVNEIYKTYFTSNYPARATVEGTNECCCEF